MEFTGLTCLVTGGSKGIGAATVELLASKGARVFTCARKQEALDEFLEKLKSKGYDVYAHTCDVTDADSLKLLMEKVNEAFDGKLNILVNTVGTYYIKPFMEHTIEDFEYLMNTNVRSAIDVCKAAYPMLKASEDSSVINMGSLGSSDRALAGSCHYNLTKSALGMLTKTLACEWASDKIRVNCVAPGLVDTELVSFLIENSDFMEKYAAETTMKRPARPDEIANAIAFFASSAASYITGQTLFVDGGHTIRGMGY